MADVHENKTNKEEVRLMTYEDEANYDDVTIEEVLERNSLREMARLVKSRALDRRALIGFMRIIAIDSRSMAIKAIVKATAPMAAAEALGFSALI